MTDIIMKAYDVLDEILKDPSLPEIKKLNQSIDHNYKLEIKAFNDAKIKYEQVLNEGGTYHPDYKQSIKTLSETKKALYELKDVKKYLELELSFESSLNEFLNTISKTISEHVPTPNKFGMIKKGGSCHVH
ncbi:MAG: YlbF family regulator [Acholeplasmataceae bacterium]|nr:YlbF family regulator [Acholeplasmataceae bacterium]